MISVRTISHDGMARTSIVREYDPAACTKCGWCGVLPAPYRYTVDRDDSARVPRFYGPQFCSIGCWREFSCWG